jgi:hypothetical protein
MPACYRREALHTATYLLNHLSCKAVSVSYPYVALHGVTPLYAFVCVRLRLLSQPFHTSYPQIGPYGRFVVSSSDTPLITMDIGVSISPPTTSSSSDMLF